MKKKELLQYLTTAFFAVVQQSTRPKIFCCLVPFAVSVFPILIHTYLFSGCCIYPSILSPLGQEEVQERRVEDPSPNFTFLCGCWTRLSCSVAAWTWKSTLKFLLAGVWIYWVISSFWECICIGCAQLAKPSWCSFSQAAEETISKYVPPGSCHACVNNMDFKNLPWLIPPPLHLLLCVLTSNSNSAFVLQ